jgi:alpha-1,3-rhamnosyl/mannosyltransferase
MGEDLVTLGPVGEDELWALYAGAAVFALPSRHEGFGLPVVEAMSQGAPVVCSDLAVLREVTAGAAVLATPGDVGVWADTLAGLLDDAAARDRLAAAGRDRAGWFSVERLVAGTRAVYREVQGL